MKKDFVLNTKKDDVLRVLSFTSNEDEMNPCPNLFVFSKDLYDWINKEMAKF